MSVNVHFDYCLSSKGERRPPTTEIQPFLTYSFFALLQVPRGGCGKELTPSDGTLTPRPAVYLDSGLGVAGHSPRGRH